MDDISDMFKKCIETNNKLLNDCISLKDLESVWRTFTDESKTFYLSTYIAKKNELINNPSIQATKGRNS